jgi:hypothetical protein
MPQTQKKSVGFEDIFRSEALSELPVGKCIAAGEKGEMMVCRTDENEFIAEGRGVKFHGKIEK